MFLDEIIGHTKLKEKVINSIESGQFSHAHLIVGNDGLGKSILAKGIGRKILNKVKDIDYPDIIEWKIPKNKKTIGVDDIRTLNSEINKKPYEGNKKVVIIYKADKMTIQAQNAFLKTIEEPPEGVFILLLCENIQFILDTIKSRCQIHNLRILGENEIELFLNRKYKQLDKNELQAALSFSEGIPGRAERFLEDESFKDIRNKSLEILCSINDKDDLEILKYSEYLLSNKEQWEDIFQCCITYLRDSIIYKEIESEERLINKDKVKQIRKVASIYSLNKLNNIIEIINRSTASLSKNVNSALVFENMLLNIQEV